jgi:hypothetical protein
MTKNSHPGTSRPVLSVVSAAELAAAELAAAQVARGAEAYRSALPAANALPVHALITVNIDVPKALSTAIRALPAVLALRAEVVRELPHFDIRNIDELETYTLATAHAYAMRVGSSAASEETLAALREQCLTLACTLYSDAVALASRGLIDAAKVSKPDARATHQRLALKLLGLTSLLRLNWDAIACRTAVQLSELGQAESLAAQLLRALGSKQLALATAAEQAQQRQRHFTLFVRAYTQVRRAIAYLRCERDADRIAPSLYRARGNRPPRPRPRDSSAGVEAH